MLIKTFYIFVINQKLVPQCIQEFILVDKKFLIAQLDLQTDPNKRAEIKK